MQAFNAISNDISNQTANNLNNSILEYTFDIPITESTNAPILFNTMQYYYNTHDNSAGNNDISFINENDILDDDIMYD